MDSISGKLDDVCIHDEAKSVTLHDKVDDAVRKRSCFVPIDPLSSFRDVYTPTQEQPSGVIALPTKLDDQICQHRICYFDEPSDSASDHTSLDGSEDSHSEIAVQFNGKTVYVNASELEQYGMHQVVEHPETFMHALNNTKRWMQGFSEEFIPELTHPQRLGTLLQALHIHEKTLSHTEFAAMKIKSSRKKEKKTKECNVVASSQKSRSYNLFLHNVDSQSVTAHKIHDVVSTGGFAKINNASPSWVIRSPKTKEIDPYFNRKCRQAHTCLTKIHAHGIKTGIEPPHKHIIYINTSTNEIINDVHATVSARALGDCCDLLIQNRIPYQDKHLIASHITQGLRNSIEAGIGHIDIKPENILLYGTETDDASAKVVEVTEARICDFDDAMDLTNFHTYMAYPGEGHTPACMLRSDLTKLNDLKERPALFEEFRDLVHKISIFEMGITLYQLYTNQNLPTTLSNNYIATIDIKRVSQSLQRTIPPLTKEQQEMIRHMLRRDPTLRPTIEEVTNAFALRDS